MKTVFLDICFVGALIASLAFTFGCDPAQPTPDPLAGFHLAGGFDPDSNKAIRDDCNDYIRTLPAEEQDRALIEYFEDDTGQHAARITIGLNDNNWRHILIYDKYNHRIKAVKYLSGHSQS